MGSNRIMIVEDEGLVALEIKEGLENMGYSVSFIASSGEEAINKLMSEPADLVLMDIRLNGTIDGIETARHIKDNYAIPVIYLTAYSDEETLERAKTTESYGYILKPIEDKALHAAIKIALYKANQERELKGSKNWLSIILSGLGEGIIVTDLKGQVKFINPAAEDITGKRQYEIVDKHLNMVFQNKLPVSRTVFDGEIVNGHNQTGIIKNREKLLIDYTIAPLRNENITIGIIIVLKKSNLDTKKEKAIQNELKKPIQIQKSILPENGSTIEGINIQWLFHPSTFGSGDLFNVFKLGRFHVGFYLFDVMGQGFSAALVSMILHRLLYPDTEKGGILKRINVSSGHHPRRRKSDFLPSVISPSRIISELNKRFYFENNQNPFFTIVYGIINIYSGRVSIARAGHPFPLFQSPTGEIEELKSEGHAIGVFKELKCAEREFTLPENGRLFLYSDGLIESNKRYIDNFSQYKLLDYLKQNAHLKLDELVTGIEELLLNLRGTAQLDDDVAFLALERKALPA